MHPLPTGFSVASWWYKDPIRVCPQVVMRNVAAALPCPVRIEYPGCCLVARIHHRPGKLIGSKEERG